MSSYTVAPPDAWARMKDDYLCGATAGDLCRRHGVSRSQFYARARQEGWRRADHPAAGAWDDAEDPAFDPGAAAPAPEALVDTAWRRAAHAIAAGRLREARGWTRLTRDLRVLAGAPAACARGPSQDTGSDHGLDEAAAVARAVGEIARAATRACDLPAAEQAEAAVQLDALTRALERSFGLEPATDARVPADPPASRSGDDLVEPTWVPVAAQPDRSDGSAPSDRRAPPSGGGEAATMRPADAEPDRPDGFAHRGLGSGRERAPVAASDGGTYIEFRQGAEPMFFKKVLDIPTADQALPGRAEAMATAKTHSVNGKPLQGPYPDGLETAEFGMGCFWGVERIFWQVPGVHVTAVGYSGGVTPNPSYEEVCSGRTGQNETVLVVFDPAVVTYDRLLRTFWEGHDPTQGMRQGNDAGTQYRSAIYTHTPAQAQAAQASKGAYQAALTARGRGAITTEIKPAGPFYFAEGYHQQYLAKNPGGYCGIGGTGVDCPAGLAVEA